MLLSLLAPTIKTIDPTAEADGGVPWWIFVVVACTVLALGALILVMAMRKGSAPKEVPCSKCGKIIMADWPACMFCKTPRAAKAAALEIVTGPLQGRTVPLDAEVTTIGSAPASTVVLTDNGVSRKHAGIRKANGMFEIADLGSSNGIYVNGEKVAKKQLQLGDVIRVGTTEMVFKG